MGLIYAEVELINNVDIMDARRYMIGEEEIRRMRVTMLIDSRAFTMAINENIQAQLELSFLQKRPIQLADGKIIYCDVVGPIDVKFANRMATCGAVVLPGDSMPILTGIPMLEMDVLIDEEKQQLVVNPKHPDRAVLRI